MLNDIVNEKQFLQMNRELDLKFQRLNIIFLEPRIPLAIPPTVLSFTLSNAERSLRESSTMRPSLATS
jgi:hypothetical protein